jgi:hypothetical protein
VEYLALFQKKMISTNIVVDIGVEVVVVDEVGVDIGIEVVVVDNVEVVDEIEVVDFVHVGVGIRYHIY